MIEGEYQDIYQSYLVVQYFQVTDIIIWKNVQYIGLVDIFIPIKLSYNQDYNEGVILNQTGVIYNFTDPNSTYDGQD